MITRCTTWCFYPKHFAVLYAHAIFNIALHSIEKDTVRVFLPFNDDLHARNK